ncbi:MAG: hypothetical protein R3F60_20285 [bacterium]
MGGDGAIDVLHTATFLSAAWALQLADDIGRPPEQLGLAELDVGVDVPWPAGLAKVAATYEAVFTSGGAPQREALAREVEWEAKPLEAWLAGDKEVKRCREALRVKESQAASLGEELAALRRPLLWGKRAHDQQQASLRETQDLLASQREALLGALADARAAVEARHRAAQQRLPERRALLKSLMLTPAQVAAGSRRLGDLLAWRLAASLAFVEDDERAAALERRDLDTRVQVSVWVRRLASAGAFEIFAHAPQALLASLTAEEPGAACSLLGLLPALRETGNQCGDWGEDDLWGQVMGPPWQFLSDLATPRALRIAPTWRRTLPVVARAWLALDGWDISVGAGQNALVALCSLQDAARQAGDVEAATRASMQFKDLWRAFREAKSHMDGSYFEYHWERIHQAAAAGDWL